MYTAQQRRSIYWTAYCCLDGEECEYTRVGLCHLIYCITGNPWNTLEHYFPEIWRQRPEGADKFWFTTGSPGWPARKEILLKAIEATYNK